MRFLIIFSLLSTSSTIHTTTGYVYLWTSQPACLCFIKFKNISRVNWWTIRDRWKSILMDALLVLMWTIRRRFGAELERYSEEKKCEMWDHPTKAFRTMMIIILLRKFQYIFFSANKRKISSAVFNDVRECKCWLKHAIQHESQCCCCFLQVPTRTRRYGINVYEITTQKNPNSS